MKKSHTRVLLKLLFWLAVAAGVAWLAMVPPARHTHPGIRVNVQQVPPPPKPEPPSAFAELFKSTPVPAPAPAASPPAAPPKEAETQPVGDEKTQPQVASVAVPVIPPREEIVPPAAGHKPMIAIVIDDMGLDLKDSRRAIDLPSAVTLSFMPYASRLKEQTREARDHGHELMLHMPMEPVGRDNPGPGALLVNLSQDELKTRFETALASFVGFDGVNNHMGSKFTADPAGMQLVISELLERHLFFLDSRTSPRSVGESLAREHGLPTIARDVFLDDTIALDSVARQLNQTEHVARRKGYAVAIGHPHAITLQALEAWWPEAEKRGFILVPVRELVTPPLE